MLIRTPDSRIMAFYKKLKPEAENGRKYSYVEVDPNDLRIFDKKCFATFAGDEELIVLLKDDKSKSLI
jgi:hypothetical protein